MAVARARSGDTVVVERGTYKEMVVITKGIILWGRGDPTINATGHDNGVAIVGGGASGAQVHGFTVIDSRQEGILALRTTKVTISYNTVRSADLGDRSPHPTGECARYGEVPGDCGEGLHLMSVTHSRVLNNIVTDSAGGILLSDERGPSAHNLLQGNRTTNNQIACGITLASHSTHAVSTSGVPEPRRAGVYENTVIDNVANDNGDVGEGAGIMLAGQSRGAGVYSNLVEHNFAEGNGLAGAAIHAHASDQDFNGNRFLDNTFTHDSLTGNSGGPGDSGAGITHTLGLEIYSPVSKLTGTVIRGNQFSDEYYGIWTLNTPVGRRSGNVIAANRFAPSVQVRVVQR